MEEIKENKFTKEIKEYSTECEKCGKKIFGSKESQVRFLLLVHKSGSKCQK